MCYPEIVTLCDRDFKGLEEIVVCENHERLSFVYERGKVWQKDL